MSFPPGISQIFHPNNRWTNEHDNFTVHLDPNASFDISVYDPVLLQQYPNWLDRYNQTTRNIQWVINHAIQNNLRMRPTGSMWALSEVAACENGGRINTKNLRMVNTLNQNHVSQQFLQQGGDPTNLFFAQCGNTVISINDMLHAKGKSLRASGGSNGQTIVGAFSTGTHGAALKFGALSEFILGMHIVVGPDRHVWVERASRRVTNDHFVSLFGAEAIIDDDIFNSALTSFGSFGFIHSVLLEVEPLFLLEQESKRMVYDAALEKAMTTGDFTDLAPQLKYDTATVNSTVYHFEVAINPHDFQKGNPAKGAYVRVMYKHPYQEPYEPKIDRTAGGNLTYGDDVLALIRQILDRLETLPGNIAERLIVPATVNQLLNVAFNRPDTAVGTVLETFGETTFRGRLFSGAYCFDRSDISQVIDLVLQLNRQAPFAGVMAMRFVKGTGATLGFTRFPDSVVLELDGVDANVNHSFAEKLTHALESNNIPYAVHWGKNNKILDKQRIKHIYGSRANTWRKHRSELMAPEVQEVFNNDFMRQCGLDEYYAIV